ncbi:MAG TPA: SlyX family protein [Steroidobacteraceae bacterium]|nr:SlyX family protein [Steroidobacteraceae bacterium]
MSSDALERLETKLAFLERANTELSDVVYRQHREIEALRQRIESLAERLSAMHSQDEQRTPEDERPPHY